jgi:hypothetical protein
MNLTNLNLTNLKLNISRYLINLKTQQIVVGFMIIGALAFFLDQKPSQETKPVDPTSVDTYIPEGMTLIPIEIQNIEALKNILGDFGMIDLYLPSYESNRPPQKIASGIKIMRAPLNPDVFAVLVSEENAPKIAQHPGAFFVTVLNPKSQRTKFNKDKKILKTHIITEI